jgi:hypothetical protein
MSATIVPFQPRRDHSRYRASHAMRAQPTPRSTSIRIDGSVSLYQLLTGLQSVGLSFRREPETGVYIISPKQEPGT